MYKIHLLDAFFDFQAKDKLKFRWISPPCDKENVKRDHAGRFTTGKSPELYPEKLRRIRYVH
ncbi:MAG: hypothetical protein LBD52_03145 [Prevotellaceae bacterium]|nr:hypothetical protein [Prevotellaceae bacterium]